MNVDQFRTASYIVKRQKDVLSIIREVESIQSEARQLENSGRVVAKLQGVVNRLYKENARLLDEFKEV